MAPGPPAAPAFSFTFISSISSFNVPLATYLTSRNESYGIMTGSLIFDSRERLLIIQRAAHDSMPNRWEIPGGACDPEDKTILHGAAREVWEESGLKVSAMGQQVGETTVFLLLGGRKICKYTFLAEVESTEVVKLDPNEHQSYMWVTEEECRNHAVQDDDAIIRITFTMPAQEAMILEGFRLRKLSGQASDG